MQFLLKASPVFILSLLLTGCLTAQTSYSFDMEDINPSTKMPFGWLAPGTEARQKGYPVKIDSVVKQSGRYSLSIEKGIGEGQFGASNMHIDPVFSGKRIRLTGYVKTENITNGFGKKWRFVKISSQIKIN